jgi:hypothetical protein
LSSISAKPLAAQCLLSGSKPSTTLATSPPGQASPPSPYASTSRNTLPNQRASSTEIPKQKIHQTNTSRNHHQQHSSQQTQQTHQRVYTQAMEMKGKIFRNQTGRSPITSSRGNKCIMIVYDYASNAILAKPLKSRKENELLQAYTKLHDSSTA